MTRPFRFLWTVLAAIIASTAMAQEMQLEWQRKISDPTINFTEPSGLTWTDRGLISVSDDTKALFAIDVSTGDVKRIASLPHKGFEGVARGWDNGVLVLVREEKNIIALFESKAEQVVGSVRLSQLDGYAEVAEAFEDSDANKGLEGIAVDRAGQRVFVIKEGSPRLLIEISSDLSTIVSVTKLSKSRGFDVDGIPGRKLDVSGMAFDPEREALWIGSDRCGCIFHYDLGQQQAMQVPITFGGLDPDTLKSVEGIALSDDGLSLFAVTDDKSESRLFSFRILQE